MSVILNTRVRPGRNVPVEGEVEGGENMNGGRTSRKEKEKLGTCDKRVKMCSKKNDTKMLWKPRSYKESSYKSTETVQKPNS